MKLILSLEEFFGLIMSCYGYHLVFYEKDSRERKMTHYYSSEEAIKSDYEVMKEKGGRGQIVACLGPKSCPEKECL